MRVAAAAAAFVRSPVVAMLKTEKNKISSSLYNAAAVVRFNPPPIAHARKRDQVCVCVRERGRKKSRIGVAAAAACQCPPLPPSVLF